MKRKIQPSLVALAALLSTSAQADGVSVEVTNLTQGVYFTPLLVAAHSRQLDLFEPGHPASAHLQAMAEGGDISGLAKDVLAAQGKVVLDPAGGLLAPGASTRTELSMGERWNRRLSLVAMLLPTNDGFVGLDAQYIPNRSGRYTYYLNGYDAGTEANDELITGGGMPSVPGIPAAPGGDGGSNGSGVQFTEAVPLVHIHPGTHGDLRPGGGISDLDSRIHRWMNPVAKVVVTVR